MTVLSDADLYRRGAQTLLASWEKYARGATGAVVRRSPGVATAVFPSTCSSRPPLSPTRRAAGTRSTSPSRPGAGRPRTRPCGTSTPRSRSSAT
jgi:hypothetical protein